MRFLYAALLAGCLLVTAPLELLLHVRVYARWRRLLLTVLPVAAVFCAWDAAAARAGQWRYPRGHVLGLLLPGGLPVEELAFFIVVPTCAVLAWEAVCSVLQRGGRPPGPGAGP